MSKNVAVFVDVANIFYAAKAAGVDIDYVTLLRSATAGRDFVRAYAYTGLDPENENQRQFHAFLSRSGYKVVSKDIRKYGDGRIKANLDIELVVDMMRMAEKLDIAVVVSGDGDFAPAIYAVQQQGVRVEVISFRGNTSSDLIDAADVFIDISNVAKVEKGARSGRRVATDGDLSMTEVPDKESGVTPRRRRRREEEERPARRSRAGRDSASRDGEAPTPGASQGALVALPGERLSRGAEVPDVLAPDDEEEAEAAQDDRPADEGEAGSGRRRRRRRGGRGRGRGGRGDEQPDAVVPEVLEPSVPEHADEVPTLPQHSGFGSVWDSQIGVPVDTATTDAGGIPEDEDIDAEPEVPEYLLTEQRRQQGRRRGGRGARGGQGGYRSAVDRERYGVGGASGYTRGPGRGPSQSSRPMPPRSSSPEPAPGRPSGGDPWSEVPPDVQELLRAELARRDAGRAGPAASSTDPGAASTTQQAEASAEAKPKRTTRRPATAKTTEPAATDEAAEAKPKRTRRSSTSRAKASDASAPEKGEEPAEAKPKRTTRRTATKASATDETAEAKPKRTRRSSSTASTADGEGPES